MAKPKTDQRYEFVEDLERAAVDLIDLNAIAYQGRDADPTWTHQALVVRRRCRVSVDGGLMQCQAGDVIREPWRVAALASDTVNFALVRAPSLAALDALAGRLRDDRTAVCNLAARYGLIDDKRGG